MSTIDLNELLPALKELHSLWRYRVKQLNGGDAMCPGTVLATFLTTVEDIGNFMKAIGYDTQEPEAVNTNCNMPELLQAIVDNKGGGDE